MLRTTTLQQLCPALYYRLFEDFCKVKDNIFILQRKKTNLEETGKNNDKLNLHDIAVAEIKKLFKNKHFNKQMKKRLTQFIQFDDSRGYLADGLLFTHICIPEQKFQFYFDKKYHRQYKEINRELMKIVKSFEKAKTLKFGRGGFGDAVLKNNVQRTLLKKIDALDKKLRSYRLDFKAAYRKDVFFGDNYFFVELELKSSKVITTRSFSSMLKNYRKSHKVKGKHL